MLEPTPQRLAVEEHGPVTIVRVNIPKLWTDKETDEAFEQLFALVQNPEKTKFVLDLSSIEYFASAALGKLVSLNRKARTADARMVLCHLTPTVQQIMRVTRLNDLFVSYESEREAVQALS